MSESRKHFTPQEKVAALRRHLLDKVPVSDLCQEMGTNPTVFYRWQQEFFQNGAAAFEPPADRRQQHRQRQYEDRIATLETKLQKKDRVVAQLLEEHFALKKSLGEL